MTTTSLEELEYNLLEYKQQLDQVEALLLDEPDNSEYGQIYQDLENAIREVEELIQEARNIQQQSIKNEFSQLQNQSYEAYQQQLGQQYEQQLQHQEQAKKQVPLTLHLPSILPVSVAQQIRAAQIKAAISGKAPSYWAIGATCQVQYAADQNWYDATIEGVSESKNFIIKYDQYQELEEINNVKRVRLKENADGYQGVAAPRRKKVEENPILSEIPKWVQVKENDDEKTKDRKKKLMKKYKSEMRFQQMDLQSKQKQDNWQKFQKSSNYKKRLGVLSGSKKDSIFKVGSDNKSRVGIMGSGRSMTQVPKRQKTGFKDDEL